MAVEIIKKTCNCPNCRESLQFSRRDCQVVQGYVTREGTKRRFQGEDMYLDKVYYKQFVEQWKVTCPTCGKKFVGFEQVFSSELIP
ncbi:MAG: hypothetical protein IKI57_00520 [Clostridia bacterium]|nr:hypothetical protein [Clostridia bacterium]